MKVIVLRYVLGVLLLSGAVAVPRGYANLNFKLSPSSNLSQGEKAGELLGKRSWIRRTLIAGVFTLGVAAITCMGIVCNQDYNNDAASTKPR